VAHDTEDAILALEASDAELGRIAYLARQRTLDEHTAERRAEELERAIEETVSEVPLTPERAHPGVVVAGAG
jgi:hypothetical protein